MRSHVAADFRRARQAPSFSPAIILFCAMAALITDAVCGLLPQAIGGQYEILDRREPFKKCWLATNTAPALREKLHLSRLRCLRNASCTSNRRSITRTTPTWPRYAVEVYAAPEFRSNQRSGGIPRRQMKYRGFFSEKTRASGTQLTGGIRRLRGRGGRLLDARLFQRSGAQHIYPQ